MTSADTSQCARLHTMCTNAFTGLATLWILNCTVVLVTLAAPEMDQYHG